MRQYFWVCRWCLGDIETEELLIGVLGKPECAICKKRFEQREMSYTRRKQYLEAKKQKEGE